MTYVCMVGQTVNYLTSVLLIVLQWLSSPLKPQQTLLHPLLRMPHIPHFAFLSQILSCAWDLWLYHVCGGPILYVIKFDHFFSLVCSCLFDYYTSQKSLWVEEIFFLSHTRVWRCAFSFCFVFNNAFKQRINWRG